MLKKPLGLIFIAALMACFGAVSTLTVFLEIIYSVRTQGIMSVGIVSPIALIGFLIYGIAPIIYYAAGIGLFLSQEWARWIIIHIIPVFIVGLFLNRAWQQAASHARFSLRSLSLFDIAMSHFGYFVQALVISGVLIGLIHWYLNREDIREYIRIAKKYVGK